MRWRPAQRRADGQVVQPVAFSLPEVNLQPSVRRAPVHRGERWLVSTPAARASLAPSRAREAGALLFVRPPRRETVRSVRRRRAGPDGRRLTAGAAVAWRAVGSIRPVLKHGPRSAAAARVEGWSKPRERNEGEGERLGARRGESRRPSVGGRAAHRRPIRRHAVAGFEWERGCCDPKDGELCLSRVKPEETLVEARSGSDVQIDRQTWV